MVSRALFHEQRVLQTGAHGTAGPPGVARLWHDETPTEAVSQSTTLLTRMNNGGRDRHRSGDLALFRRALYQLSYPTADLTGFEPATSGLTGRRALQAAPQVPTPAITPAGDRLLGAGGERPGYTTPPARPPAWRRAFLQQG
jgi:hypothetical protein